MSSAVCQGLQILEPWPKMTATRPYFPRSLSCARKTRVSDSDSEKYLQEKKNIDKELENNNNNSDFDCDKNNKNQFCSNGGDMGGWSFIQALSNTSQSPKAAAEEKEKLYIHPLVKRSSSQLSDRSLEMCTENLGSETGSVISEEEIINSSNCDRGRERSKSSLRQLTKVNSREFPPPLTTIRGSSQVQMKTHREGGRLVMKAVRVPTSNSYFEAERGDGRLRLHLSKDYVQRFDTKFESQATLAVQEEEEEEEEVADTDDDDDDDDDDDEVEEEEEEEAEEEVEEEEEDEEGERKEEEEEEEQEEVKYRGKGTNGNNGNVGGEVENLEIGNYERGRRRCNEGGGRRNKLLLIQELCWVATS